MKKYQCILLILFLFANFVQGETTSSIPQYINYQGMLTNAEGQPLETKEYKLTFKIFNKSTEGSVVWGPQIFDGVYTAGHGAKVPVVRGHFNVILGPTDTEGRSIIEAFQTNNAYLEISVENNNPIMPRQRILTTPYAVVSETVKGPDLYVDSQNGFVGIGSKTPKASLYIKHSGANDTPSILINNSSPEIVFETGDSHFNWRIAAQEDIDSGLEISSGNKDADASDDSDADWKNLIFIKRENDIANVMINGHMTISEQPRCRVRLAKEHYSNTTWNDIEWDEEDYDIGNCWNSDNKSQLVAPITGLYSLQGLIVTYNSDENYAYINIYYLYEKTKTYLGYWSHDRNMKDHVEWITISLQHFMEKGGCLVIELRASESGRIIGGIAGQNSSVSFMTFAKIQ